MAELHNSVEQWQGLGQEPHQGHAAAQMDLTRMWCRIWSTPWDKDNRRPQLQGWNLHFFGFQEKQIFPSLHVCTTEAIAENALVQGGTSAETKMTVGNCVKTPVWPRSVAANLFILCSYDKFIKLWAYICLKCVLAEEQIRGIISWQIRQMCD